MSVATKNKQRQTECLPSSLSVVVRAKEVNDGYWKKTTDLISISRSGAGFLLDRKCEVGRLVSLMAPIPKHLRCYDAEKELYRVWGLIQHCSPVAGSDGEIFHVGVAFTGRVPPASYNKNPLQSYRVTGINADGTWRIVETKSEFIVRRHTRFQISLETLLSAMDSQNQLVTDEAAKTENLSASGAAVFSTLKVDVGDSVNFDCIQHNFSTLAIVRNRQEADGDDPPRLHLEFIGPEFPINEIVLPSEETGEN